MFQHLIGNYEGFEETMIHRAVKRASLLLFVTLVLHHLLNPSVLGQTIRSGRLETLQQLLAMPAPTPRIAASPDSQQQERPEDFFDEDHPPVDDAELQDILDYWVRYAQSSRISKPSPRIRERLLGACIEDPARLPTYISLMPQTEESAQKIKSLYDKQLAEPNYEPNVFEPVRKWLMFHSTYFLAELQAMASKVKDDVKGGYVDREDALQALVRIDWNTANSVLSSLEQGNQPRSRALAIVLRYERAIREKEVSNEELYRNELKTIASDRHAPGRARDYAIESLSLSEWSGRDDWYLSLFHDDSLFDLSDGYRLFNSLQEMLVHDPEKWIPVLTKLVKSDDQGVRNLAVNCLITFQNRDARKDALEPLLPWLSDPKWANDNFQRRLRLIQSMGFIDMPESVPGLISIVEHYQTESSSDRSYAADALIRYKDPRAVPALRKALTVKDSSDRKRIIESLLSSNGFSVSEQVAAVEEFAASADTGSERMSKLYSSDPSKLTLPFEVGGSLAVATKVPSSLIAATLSRADILKKTNPRVALSMLEIAQRWQDKQVDVDLVQRIANGSATSSMIANALERREKLRESVGSELQSLVAKEGPASGIAAVLLDDNAIAESVLSSGTVEAKLGLLVCARLTQMSLTVGSIEPLLRSKDPLLVAAAEEYLLVEDSVEAREILVKQHESRAFITGWRELSPSGNDGVATYTKAEEQLRTEFLKDEPPIETFALLTDSTRGYSSVLRVYKDRAVYTQRDDPARYRERTLSITELADFKDFLTLNKFEDIGPQINHCFHGCVSFEFLTLSKSKGRRVVNQGGMVSGSIVERFLRLANGVNVKTHYSFEKEIEGLEVLYSNSNPVVHGVWKNGNDVLIFTARDKTPEEEKEDQAWEQLHEDDDDDDGSVAQERRRRRQQSANRLLSWRKLVDGQAIEETERPKDYPVVADFNRFPLTKEEQERDVDNVQVLSSDSIIIARNFDGLWRQSTGQPPTKLTTGEGAYLTPIASPDGRWIVVSKTDSDWSKPGYLVRYDLVRNKEYRVDIAPADNLYAIRFLPSHNQILVRRATEDYYPGQLKTVGPEAPEYYLVDAASGEKRLVQGFFDPLLIVGNRFLQPTKNKDEFWVAIPDKSKHQTQVGRYDLRNFTFKPTLILPQIEFSTLMMWADEAENKLYVVYKGQLLRMRLQAK